jgi:F-type H+-transporting ATPase subunit a
MGYVSAGPMMLSQDVDFFIHSFYEFQLFGQTLSINTTMISTTIVSLVLLGLILFARHEIMKDYEEPNAVQNAVEMIVELLDGIVASNMGNHAPAYRNYVETLMAFIFLSNISGLFGLRPPTADFGTTFALALITFVMIEYAWIKSKGIGFVKDLFEPIFVFLPVNIISEFATPVSMSLRLFGNVLAGTIMMGLWYSLLPWFAKIGIPAFLHTYFDLFSGAIQTYVFGMLTMTFITDKYGDM